MTPDASSARLIAIPSSLVMATGFSKAISFAPLLIPSSMSGSRTLGGVQKQKTSGLTSSVSFCVSVPLLAEPNFAAAASRRV